MVALDNRESNRAIPAFLSIDVEPNGFQLARSESSSWSGYDAIVEWIEGFRLELAKVSRSTPNFGWYFRTDPQIAEVYGRPDHALTAFPDRTAHLRRSGDYFGAHCHPIRWCNERRSWIHDFADADWNAECTKFALDAFARWNDGPTKRFRAGAGFLTEEIVSILDQHGVEIDISLEPVEAWPASFSEVPSGIDSSPYTGVHTGCPDAPRIAYRPSHRDFRIAAKRDARTLTVVPLTTYDFAPWQPRWRNLIDAMIQKPKQRDVRVLHLSEEWPNAEFYWDLVSRRLSTMRVPYLSLAVRTDAPGSLPITRSQKLLDALLRHPLVERLDFGDPNKTAAALVGRKIPSPGRNEKRVSAGG
jgi:hypothetical protein